MTRHLYILGIRGVPAAHGGFETFAEKFSTYLVEKNWDVTVYCQIDSGEICPPNDTWSGVKRIFIPIKSKGAIGTMEFDFKCILDVIKRKGRLVLTLGYNTAAFSTLFRIFNIVNVMNMDGIEWSRAKWSGAARCWLWLNERIGCLVSNHLIADHPEIKRHLLTRVSESKITMIPYGADEIFKDGDFEIRRLYGLAEHSYALVIARPEPENSILEIVRAFSNKTRGINLVILGNYDGHGNAYHRSIIEAASDEVIFLGAIYDKYLVASLRANAKIYVHGHQVGGTNPSLVEALAAGNAIIAHDNKYNRWVAGDGAVYFNSVEKCSEFFDKLNLNNSLTTELGTKGRQRHNADFLWSNVLSSYESLLSAADSL
jgi:glycosyltransferase involved in cell wall biosynthesis